MEHGAVRVNKLILDVVAKQLETDNPPQARETFERLLGEGMGEEDARRLIGTAVIAEMRAVVAEGRPFDQARYLKLLEGLSPSG